MKVFRKLICFFFFCLALVCATKAQVPYFQHYTLLKKNEPVQVKVVFQDKTGLMWYGTNKGLFKFDGTNFRRFTPADSLPDENVTALAEDSLGRIWTGHKNGALSYLVKDHFVRFNPPEGLGSQEVSDILFDRKGCLWYSTLNDGLYYFMQGRLYRLDDQEGLPDLFIYDISEDDHGNIWAGTDGGVAVCALQDRKVFIRVYNYGNGLPDNIIRRITPDSDGKILMGTEDSGLISFDPQTGKYTPVMPGGWSGVITDFLADESEIWISSPTSGLVVYDRSGGTTKTYSGSAFASIQVLRRDHEGNIWAGTRSEVMRTLGDEVEFINAFGLNDQNVIALTVDGDGNIWFSTSEGLFRWTSDASGKISIKGPMLPPAFSKFTVISLYVDPYGQVWAGLYGEGVVRLNPKTGAIRHLRSELRNGNVFSITGKDDIVWLATLGGGSRISITGDRLSIKSYSHQEGLVSDYIYQVFVDSRNRVWFATDGKGVDMMDESGVHHYEEGLNSRVVYGFAEDGTHQIWVNVQGEGLYRFDGKKFIAFDPQGTRLHNNNISCLTSTPAGRLVVMNDVGIEVYDAAADKVSFMGEDVGIRNLAPNLNALARDSRGNIFMGTDGGIVKYSDTAGKKSMTPQPIIETFKVMNEPVEVGQEMSFRYNENSITINYLGLWYQNPSALAYQFRLKNYDQEWISSRNRSMTYSSLPPGEYTFEVKASDSDDFRFAREASVQFVIRPPFWKTAWFILLSIIVAGFLIYTFILFRERSLMEDKRLLEAKVEERTLEIKKKNEEIHAQAEEIRGINENLEGLVHERTQQLEKKNKALEEYAFINAHELRAPVASILGLINLMRTVKLQEDEKIYLKHLESSAEKLDSVVRSIGKAIERGGMK